MSYKNECLQQLMSSRLFIHLSIQKIDFNNLTGTVLGIKEKKGDF